MSRLLTGYRRQDRRRELHTRLTATTLKPLKLTLVDVLEAGKMGVCMDVNDFDKGQIVISIQVSQNIYNNRSVWYHHL